MLRRLSLALLICVGTIGLAATGFAEEPAAPATSPLPVARKMVATAPCVLSALRIINARMAPMLTVRLELDTATGDKLKDLLKKQEAEEIPLIEAQQKAAQDFIDALLDQNTGTEKLTELGQKAMDAEAAILSARIKALAKVRELFNEEQNKKLDDLLGQFTTVWKPRPQAPAIPPPDGVYE